MNSTSKKSSKKGESRFPFKLCSKNVKLGSTSNVTISKELRNYVLGIICVWSLLFQYGFI